MDQSAQLVRDNTDRINSTGLLSTASSIHPEEDKVPDQMSGCIGGTPDEKVNKFDSVYKLKLDGLETLSGKRRYYCYENKESGGK